MRGNKHILPIAVITLVISAISVVIALAIDWLPDPASKEADRVDLLMADLRRAAAETAVVREQFGGNRDVGGVESHGASMAPTRHDPT